ncbi:hypothetical protein NST37_17185 [Brevibacillus sp. FSL K6-6036]|jgi:hypothetical protein|uniref:hypothetical protein n=1 Tax=Brevibacillus TaxID=55080 RepID=UPI00248F7808|nr:hypothetical protein [Brevibacillus parabrevis]
MEQIEKKSHKKTIIGLIVVGLILFFIASSCDNDKGKISSALYGKVAREIVENGGDPQFNINYIEVKGNNADISYDLLGGTFKTSAIKTKDGTWVVR